MVLTVAALLLMIQAVEPQPSPIAEAPPQAAEAALAAALLTDDEVRAAITKGRAARALKDFVVAKQARSNLGKREGVSAFSVVVHSAQSLIAYNAFTAKRHFDELTVEQVNEVERDRSRITVTAEPATNLGGAWLGTQAGKLADVEMIVVRRAGKTIKPLSFEQNETTFQNAYGKQEVHLSGRAVFPADAFSPDGPLVVIVVVPQSAEADYFAQVAIEAKDLQRIAGKASK
jgi:hypothetical protein